MSLFFSQWVRMEMNQAQDSPPACPQGPVPFFFRLHLPLDLHHFTVQHQHHFFDRLSDP